MNRTAEEYISATLGVVLLLVIFFIVAFALGYLTTRVHCYEDEVYAVQVDHNPKHGLTWQCESTQHFIERNK